MRDSFPGEITNWDDIQVRDIIQDIDTLEYYMVVNKKGKAVLCKTNEYITIRDYKSRKFKVVYYPVISKRAEEQSPPATLVSREELQNFKSERKYPVSWVEKEIDAQVKWNKHWQSIIDLYNYKGFSTTPETMTKVINTTIKSLKDRIEVKTFSTKPDLQDLINITDILLKPYTTLHSMKINRKYKAYELMEFLKDKKNIYLRISEVVQPFDEKLMICFSSVTGEHEGIIISENNKAELIFNDHIYRLVQICKINKSLK